MMDPLCYKYPNKLYKPTLYRDIRPYLIFILSPQRLTQCLMHSNSQQMLTVAATPPLLHSP